MTNFTRCMFRAPGSPPGLMSADPMPAFNLAAAGLLADDQPLFRQVAARL